MPLRTLTPAPGIFERIAEQFSSTTSESSFKLSTLRSGKNVRLGLAAPHPVFNLGLEDIDALEWISKVRMTGWRYFVTSGNGVVAASEASTSSPEGAVMGTLTNQGPFVEGTEDALAIAEESAEVAAGKFVLGMVRIPALYVVALWLRNEDSLGEFDRFVPAAPTIAPLKANAIMTSSEFIAALRALKASREQSGSGSESSN